MRYLAVFSILIFQTACAGTQAERPSPPPPLRDATQIPLPGWHGISADKMFVPPGPTGAKIRAAFTRERMAEMNAFTSVHSPGSPGMKCFSPYVTGNSKAYKGDCIEGLLQGRVWKIDFIQNKASGRLPGTHANTYQIKYEIREYPDGVPGFPSHSRNYDVYEWSDSSMILIHETIAIENAHDALTYSVKNDHLQIWSFGGSPQNIENASLEGRASKHRKKNKNGILGKVFTLGTIGLIGLEAGAAPEDIAKVLDATNKDMDQGGAANLMGLQQEIDARKSPGSGGTPKSTEGCSNLSGTWTAAAEKATFSFQSGGSGEFRQKSLGGECQTVAPFSFKSSSNMITLNYKFMETKCPGMGAHRSEASQDTVTCHRSGSTLEISGTTYRR